MSKLDVLVSDKFIDLIRLVDNAEKQGFKLKLYAFPMLDVEGTLSSYKLFVSEELGYCENKLQIRWNSGYVEEPTELSHSRCDFLKNEDLGTGSILDKMKSKREDKNKCEDNDRYYVNVADNICEIILKDIKEKEVDNTFIAKNNGVPVTVDKGFFSVSNYNGELLISCKY